MICNVFKTFFVQYRTKNIIYANNILFKFYGDLKSNVKHTKHVLNCIRTAKTRPLAGILALSLFLCLVYPCMCDPGREMVVVFKGDQTEVPYDENNGTITMRKPRAFRVPAFVGGVLENKEFLAVLCDARYDGFSDWSFIEGAAKTSYGDYKKWSNAEIFAKNTRKNLRHSVVGDVTAVMKGNKIYVLVPSWDVSTTALANHVGNTGWDPLMIVRTVINYTDLNDGGASIEWDTPQSLKSLLPSTLNGKPATQFIGGVGNGMVTKNGAIVFPIQMANNKKQVASSVMYSTDDGETWTMGGETPIGPSECSVVEWGEGKLLLNTRYDNGYRRVFESDNMGKTWKESLMFSEIWGNQANRRGVGSQGSAITAPVDEKDVLFFSHPQNKKGGYNRDTLQLWLSDGQRIMCIGTISEKGKGENSGYSIMAHIGTNLYSIHEINPFGEWEYYNAVLTEWDRVIALSPLDELFESAKETVRLWRRLDTKLQNKGVPTNGLVGYLANSTNNNSWSDMYNCVNATVQSGQRVSGGFRFNFTQGSGAQWPVRNQGQNQVYIFTKRQFTLSATVRIHSISGNEDVSIFGASRGLSQYYVLLGLGYTKDKKWYAIHNNRNKVATQVSVDVDKEYNVAITFESRKASVFVNGVAIAGTNLKISNPAAITHFFMGGMGKSSTEKGGSCTVKNVMLFNRALSKEEINKLSQADLESALSEITTTITTTMEPPILETNEETVSATQTTSKTLKPKENEISNVVRITETQDVELVYEVKSLPESRESSSTITIPSKPETRLEVLLLPVILTEDNPKTVPTTKVPSSTESEEAELTTTTTNNPEIDEEESSTTNTDTPEIGKNELTTTTTNTSKHPKTELITSVANTQTLCQDESTMEVTNAKENPQTESPTEEAKIPDIYQKDSDMTLQSAKKDNHQKKPIIKVTSNPEKKKSELVNKFANAPQNQTIMPSNESKAASVTLRTNKTNKKGNQNTVINSISEYRNANLNNNPNGDNSVAVRLSAVAWVSAVCALIALIGF